MINRAARILAQPASQALLAAPGFPLPDRTALRRVGSTDARDFMATGVLLCAALVEVAGLEPDHAILDVGCGWGRLAMPLAAQLGARGGYIGMDAAAEAIAWCRRHIGEADPRFRFHHADIRNSYANPQGRIPARRAVLLPWEERFDRVVAFSLFTHLLPDALVRYLAEAARLCRPGGVMVATFFLLDPAARAAIARGRSDREFPAAHGIARLANPAIAEDAVAYDPAEILALFEAAGFEASWRPGAWCDRGIEPFDYQDLVIARRVGAASPSNGTRGAVQVVSGGALRGWAWDVAQDGPPLLRLEVDGAVVAEGRPDQPTRGAPVDGPPVGAPAGFALPLPPHLVGRRLRDVRLLAGPEALPLLSRPALLLADPIEEMARAWRREALRSGLWRIESVAKQADGSLNGRIWAIPPLGGAPFASPALFLGKARVSLQPLEDEDLALDAALGLAPGTVRPGYAFQLPASLAARGGVLRLGLAADRPWAPFAGLFLPPGGDALAGAACLRAATGRSEASFAPRCVVPVDGFDVATAPKPAALLDALEGIEAAEESALVESLAAALAPGGVLLLGTPGAAALIDGSGGTARLLDWQRSGVAEAPEASPGRRRLRSPAHIANTWGGAFTLLDWREAALSGLRDLVLLRRH